MSELKKYVVRHYCSLEDFETINAETLAINDIEFVYIADEADARIAELEAEVKHRKIMLERQSRQHLASFPEIKAEGIGKLLDSLEPNCEAQEWLYKEIEAFKNKLEAGDE